MSNVLFVCLQNAGRSQMSEAGVLTGLDRASIEMREVSPLVRLLSPGDRERALALGPSQNDW